MPDLASALSNGRLSPEHLVECLLFVADGPTPVAQLAQALELPVRDIENALAALEAAYENRGLRLQRWQDRVQLTTVPGAAAHIERFLGLAATARLSHAALETLAIVAYQQPVTRPQIEAVRGVNSDSVLKSLLAKGLLEEVGRSEGVGRPILYRTTPEFLQHFGLSSLGELPPLNLPDPLAEASGSDGAIDSEVEVAVIREQLPVTLWPEPEAQSDHADTQAPSPPKPATPPAWQGDWAPVGDGEEAEAQPD